MAENKLTNEQIEGIVGQLKIKQNNLKAIAALTPMLESCIKDYDMLIAQVEAMKTPTVKVAEKPESKKS